MVGKLCLYSTAIGLAFLSLSAGGEPLLKHFPKDVFKMEVVHFQPIEGHHFELAAPQVCEKATLVSKERTKIKCQMLELGSAKIELNICDDAKTFCKPTAVSVSVAEAPQGFKKAALNPELLEMKEEIHGELLSGFQVLSLKEAKDLARKTKEPVLIMISTDWCPPCNQSKEYFLSTTEFQELTKKWLKVYVDGDHESSMKYDQEFSFFEYPTFILANSNFTEVARFREEFTILDFKNWMDRSLVYLSSGYQKMRDVVLDRERRDWKQRAFDLLTFKSQDAKDRDLRYVLEGALAKNDEEIFELFRFEDVPQDLKLAWMSVNKERLTPTPFSKEELNAMGLTLAELRPSFYTYLAEVCQLDQEHCEKEKKSLSLREEQILKRHGRSEVENRLLLADEFYSRAYFFKSQKNAKEERIANELCVKNFEKILPQSKLQSPRYALQGILACAKDFDLKRVEKIYLDLIEKYPEDSTFLLRYARFLKDQRRDLKQAKVWILKALEKSYDFNWFYSASLKIQIDQALGHSADALKTINEAYMRIDLSQDSNHASRYQAVLARFRDLERNF